jgi:hypothetical protein
MGYLFKAGVGLALFIGGVVLFNVELQKVLDIGTCASGNTPYQISRPCPAGTGTTVVLMVGSIFGGLIGAGIFAFRGDPPWGQRRRSMGGMFGLGVLAWGFFFAGTGVALLLGKPYGDVASGTQAGSQLGATITAVTFLVMGVPALAIGLWGVISGLRGKERPTAASSGAGSMTSGGRLSQWSQFRPGTGRSGGGDTLGKIERLQKLKESGALSQAEFDREKAKVLAEG